MTLRSMAVHACICNTTTILRAATVWQYGPLRLCETGTSHPSADPYGEVTRACSLLQHVTNMLSTHGKSGQSLQTLASDVESSTH